MSVADSESEGRDEFLDRIKTLRLRIEELEGEVSRLRRALPQDRQHIRELELLSQTGVGFVELSSDADIWAYIAARLERLAQGAIIAVNAYDAATGELVNREICGLESPVKLLRKITGQEIVGASFPVPEYGFEGLLTRKLVLVEQGLYDLFGGRVPRPICRLAEKALAIRLIYGLGFAWKGELYGSAIIVTRKGTRLSSEELLEAFINQASVSLQRRRLEEEKNVLEERLREAQKMEALGTLAGGVAHDFNNLLMCILGSASQVLLDLEPDHLCVEDIESIRDMVKSGAELSNQLVGMARSGKYEVVPTNLNELVEGTTGIFGRTRKEVSIERRCEPDLCSVAVDRSQLEQVLLNLYVNAWQAMGGGGLLSVRTRNTELGPSAAQLHDVSPGLYVEVAVKDDGAGIDPAVISQIFDPFFTTKERGKGTGLGLASAYGIIRNHGGSIEVESELGHGSTFTILLPTEGAQPNKNKSLTAPKPKGGVETIMVVDDETMILRSSRRLLGQLGYCVLTASSGQDALELFQQRESPIDLVILDMIMPGMNGEETLRRLKELDPEVKVLVASGYALEGDSNSPSSQSWGGFLQKPFDIDRLALKIRTILDDD